MREMQKILSGLDGVLCQMDDILIHTKDEQSHKQKVKEVLERLIEAGITLNEDKCEFFKQKITFLGHVIDHQGVQADPDKISAIQDFPTPKDTKELKRFFGMVNYLGKFQPKLAEDTAFLRQLLQKDVDWLWDAQLEGDYAKVKEKLSSAPVLSHFSLNAETWLSTDASSYGLGAALLQMTEDGLKPVAFASRALTDAEQRYAQIEKEALAICWAAEKFYYYLAGRYFHVETDHKPLVSVMSEKELAKLPLRVQRFRLRMMKFSYDVTYTPGEKLVLADALSRAPVQKQVSEIEPYLIGEMVRDLPISPSRMRKLKEDLANDMVSCQLISFIQTEWPHYQKCPSFVRNYYTHKDRLTVVDDLLFYDNRLFIPLLERQKVLEEIHRGHLGETKCLNRAREVLWWPGLTKDIREMVKTCPVCLKHRKISKEPMISTPFPDRPWWRLGMDLCFKDDDEYLVVMDYYSRYLIAEKLPDCHSVQIGE